MASLLEVADLAKEEEEIHAEEVGAPMAEEEVMKEQINGVEFAKKALMKKRTAGTKESHNVIIAKGLGTFKRTVALVSHITQHLPERKIWKGACSLLVKRKLKNIRIYGTWTADVATI